MSDKGHQEFIKHACESFKEDDELALASKNQLETVVEQANVDLGLATKNLDAGYFSKNKNRVIITIIMLLVSFAMIAYFIRGLNSGKSFVVSEMVFSNLEFKSLVGEYSHLNDDEKFILFGDPESKTVLEIAESRWRKSPENAAYYLEYVIAYKIAHNKTPKGMLAYGDKIDPENSIYRLLSVAQLREGEEVVVNQRELDPYRGETMEERLARNKQKSIERRERKRKEREERKRDRERMQEREERAARGESVDSPKRNEAEIARENSVKSVKKTPTKPQMVILDKVKFEDLLGILYEAAEKKFCSEHVDDLMKERVPLLYTHRKSFSDHMVPFIYLSQTNSATLLVYRVNEVFIAEAQRCAKEKDAESLIRLISAHEKIAKQLSGENNVTLVQALVSRAFIKAVLQHFIDAAEACELPELVQKKSDLLDVFSKHEAALESARSHAMTRFDYQKNGSVLASIMTPLITNKVLDKSVISPVDQEPMRRVEHSILSRVAMSLVGFTFIVLAGLLCIANRLKNILVRNTSKQLLGVLGVKDWSFVLILGALLPVIIFYLLDRLSPLQITAFGVASMEGMHSVARVVVFFVLLLCSQILVLEWRIARVTNCVFGKQNVRLVWVALILALVPLCMVHQIVDSSDALKWYMVLMISLFLLIVFTFVRFLPGFFSYKNSILCRAMVMSLTLTAMVTTLLFPIYQAEEYHWIAKDELIKFSPDRAAYSKIEGEVTLQFVKETRELMGWSEVE